MVIKTGDHPLEVLDHAQTKLDLFNTMLWSDDGTVSINLDNKDVLEGVYWTLSDISRDMRCAIDALKTYEMKVSENV